MTDWRLADFVVEVPAPLQQFLAAQPVWLDKISLPSNEIVMTPRALEAFVNWALHRGHISYGDLVALGREDLLGQQIPSPHREAPRDSAS